MFTPGPGPSDWLPLAEPPAQLWRYARKETLHPEPGRERRRDRRYSLITSVRVVPIDGRQRPVGPSFVALSSGMSVSGIRLIHTEPPSSKFLRLEFEGQPASFVLSVLRTRPIGDCYEIAGRIRKLRQSSPKPAASALLVTTVSHAAVSHAPLVNPDAESRESPSGEFLQWAGVSAAAQALLAESKHSRSAD